jgi:hypothetical protein
LKEEKKMKARIANSIVLDTPGNGDRSPDRETSTAIVKQWGHKLGVCSIFATVPAMLLSNIPRARADEAKKPEVSVAGPAARLRERPNKSYSNPALLKRQSKFRLPHQGSFDIRAALAASDDCPGRAIPGGTYTVAAPYSESGDTTGANDTVTRAQSPSYYFYYYYSYDAQGPDHVYSFTLTGRGPNPQIRVSTTSGTYKPLIYVLQGGPAGACPAGTGNLAANEVVLSDSRWTTGSTNATLEEYQVNNLPLDVPLYLFVDSARNDASGSGSYTVQMRDVTIAPTPGVNPIDYAQFFVQQQYRDFLNREPDADGLAFWTNEITSCGGNTRCMEVKGINTSAAFFLSIEFQQSGYLVDRLYKSSFGNLPGTPVPVRLNEFLPDTQKIGHDVVVLQSGWEQQLENNKQAFILEFVQRPRFASVYPTTTSPDEFVDALFANAEVTPSATERADAISGFGGASDTSDVPARAHVLRQVAENQQVVNREFNRAFVLMQYFGYLHRNPNDAPEPTLNFQGYNFWLNKLDNFSGNYIDAEMVKAFINSDEYRHRFGP